MPHSIPTGISWQTPSIFDSTEFLTATEYNKVVEDVAYFRARPWLFAYMNAGAGIAVSSGGSSVIFTAGTTTVSVASTSGVGSIGYASSAFSAPTPGLYRFTARATISAGSSGHVRLRATGQNSGGGQWNIPGSWASQNTAFNAGADLVFTAYLGTGAPMGAATSVFFSVDSIANAFTVLGTAVAPSAQGPGSTPPYYNTYVFIEYLGTSFGSY